MNNFKSFRTIFELEIYGRIVLQIDDIDGSYYLRHIWSLGRDEVKYILSKVSLQNVLNFIKNNYNLYETINSPTHDDEFYYIFEHFEGAYLKKDIFKNHYDLLKNIYDIKFDMKHCSNYDELIKFLNDII